MFDGVWAWLHRLVFGGTEVKPATQLTEEKARAIALASVNAEYGADTLQHSGFEDANGDVVWLFATVQIGTGLLVKVDDESGTVIDVARIGLR